MSKVSVREAAFLTGKSRETINTATKDGTLSYSLNERKHKVIDVAELERVYPLVNSAADLGQSEVVRDSQTPDGVPSDLREQVAVLRERVEALSGTNELLKTERERERRQLEGEIENLRTSLEKTQESLEMAQEQQGRAMLLLTHQSEEGRDPRQQLSDLEQTVLQLKQQNKRIYRELQEQRGRGLWKRLFG